MKVISPQLLLAAYAKGYFPMADSAEAEDISWYEPTLRGILPLDAFRVSKNTLRFIRNAPLKIRVNHDFEGVMRRCAARPSTWISEPIIASYVNLHQLGYAHSVGVYQGGQLQGGLYGVSLGAAFFGESMFHLAPELDKVALYYCHQRLLERGFTLWDTQFYTPHLGSFGAIEIPQADYLELLSAAIGIQAAFD